MLIVICEDRLEDMERNLDLCERYAKEHRYAISTLCYPNAEKLLADAAAREADVFLLDIIMPWGDSTGPAGIALARQLRAGGYRGAIIFMTSSTDYYPEGFEVEASHYLLKPPSYDDFSAALGRVIRHTKAPERVITVPVNRIQVPIAASLIHYVEVYGRESLLHTSMEDIRVLMPLKKIESLLSGDPFLRCYRSYIINMDYISSMEEDHFVMEGGTRIPISLRSKQQLKERFFAYRLAKVRH